MHIPLFKNIPLKTNEAQSTNLGMKEYLNPGMQKVEYSDC